MGVVFGLADRIAVLVYGEVIAFDTPASVRANPRVQALPGSVLAEAQAAGSEANRALGRSRLVRSPAASSPATAKSHDPAPWRALRTNAAGRDRRAARAATARAAHHGQGHHGRSTPPLVKSGEGATNPRPQALRDRPPGIGYVPENRDIFPKLTVHQNLMLGEKAARGGRWSFDDMYRHVPAA